MPPKGIVLPLNDRPATSGQPWVSLACPTVDCQSNSLASSTSDPNTAVRAGCASLCALAASRSPGLCSDPVLAPLPHLRGSGTTRRAPNRTPTATQKGLPPVCPEPARRRLISAREGCWGKTTRSKSFSIQLMIPVRTSADPVVLRSGQVFSQGEDTGGACSKPALGNLSPKGAGVGTAQLL